MTVILRSANLGRYVQERTHRHGHILHPAKSRDDDILINGVAVSSLLSGHFLVNINVYLQQKQFELRVFHIENISQCQEDQSFHGIIRT